MKNEPDWAKVLHTLHEGNASIKHSSDEPLESHFFDLYLFLLEETDLNEQEIDEALRYLDDVDLVKRFDVVRGDREYVGGLTKEGFQLAHEREMRKEQTTHNRILAAFTVLVGISALIQVISIVVTESGPIQWILGFIAISGALAFAYVLKGKAHVLVE